LTPTIRSTLKGTSRSVSIANPTDNPLMASQDSSKSPPKTASGWNLPHSWQWRHLFPTLGPSFSDFQYLLFESHSAAR
jgi:hypothetical protein